MKFKSEKDAWEYWQDMYYFSDMVPKKGAADQAALFNQWVERYDVTWESYEGVF